MASNELVKEFERNQLQVAELEAEIEKAMGAQIEKLNLLKDRDTQMRQAILEAMEENGVDKFDGDIVTITRVKATKRVTIDTKRLKEELPDVYEDFAKTSDVKASIRIKVKTPTIKRVAEVPADVPVNKELPF